MRLSAPVRAAAAVAASASKMRALLRRLSRMLGCSIGSDMAERSAVGALLGARGLVLLWWRALPSGAVSGAFPCALLSKDSASSLEMDASAAGSIICLKIHFCNTVRIARISCELQPRCRLHSMHEPQLSALCRGGGSEETPKRNSSSAPCIAAMSDWYSPCGKLVLAWSPCCFRHALPHGGTCAQPARS